MPSVTDGCRIAAELDERFMEKNGADEDGVPRMDEDEDRKFEKRGADDDVTVTDLLLTDVRPDVPVPITDDLVPPP